MKTDTATPARKSTRKPAKKANVAAVKRPVGRPAVELNLNFGSRGFTVKDIQNRYAKSAKLITSVAITQKLKKMVAAAAQNDAGKVLVIAGKLVKGRGRPFIVYKYVTPTEAAEIAAAAQAAQAAPAVAEVAETPAAE